MGLQTSRRMRNSRRRKNYTALISWDGNNYQKIKDFRLMFATLAFPARVVIWRKPHTYPIAEFVSGYQVVPTKARRLQC